MSLPVADVSLLAAGAPEAALVAALTAIEEGTLGWPPEGRPHVASLLSHPSRTVRRRAAGALAAGISAGDIDAAQAEALLDDGDGSVRWGAAFALHRAGRPGPRVVDVALETFADDNGDLRWAASAVIASASATTPDLAVRLRALATAGSATTRKMALLCLADAGDRDPSPACAALGDEDVYVRLAAVTVLGRAGDDAATVREALAAVAAADPEATVRRAADAVLRRLDRTARKETR